MTASATRITDPSTRFLAVVLAIAGVLLAACGSNSSLSAPALASSSSAPLPDSSIFIPTEGAVDTAPGGVGGDTATFVSLDMSVRVVNLFISRGSHIGTAIDVWAGQAGNSSSKKLITVPYGQVSDYFAPAVSASTDSTPAHVLYDLTFYPTGNTTDVLGEQNENSSLKQKLTMTLGPGDPTTGGGELQVAADQLGSGPEGGGFTTTSIPRPPAGKAIVELSAIGLANPAGSTSPTSLQMSSGSGICEVFVEPDTGRLHDPKSATTQLTGGTSRLAYVVEPGDRVAVDQVVADEDVTGACHGRPVVTFDPKLAAGQGEYAFVYGTDIKSARVLVVPVG